MKREEVPQRVYGVKEENNIYFTMRDGVRIATDVYRPNARGKFPALLAISPYGKDRQRLGIPPQPSGSPLWDGAVEAGDTDYIVSKGYAHVIVDIRGTGSSEGEYVGVFSKQEGEDGYDLVEAVAKQPWCDGNIGMIGMSYFGASQLLTAAQRPPHLKAICPYQTAADLYRMGYDDGILHAFFEHWGWSVIAGTCVSAMVKNLPGEELDRRIQEAKNNPDLRNYSRLYGVLANPRVTPPFFDILLNPTNGPFYWDKSPHTKLDKIDIPVYCGAGWGATQLYILARTFDIYQGVRGPRKLLLTDFPNPDRPFHQWHDEFIRWYDYWLKGIDNGIMNEPPIRRFIGGVNQWRYETEWPLARTKWIKFYLRSRGRLSTESESITDIVPNSFVQEPLTVTTEIKSLKYVTPSVIDDTEVAGPIALYLFASIDTDDTNWLVTLHDIRPDGSQTLLSRGYLKASYRDVDETISKPWRPIHQCTKPEAVVPGQVYEYAIEIQPVSHVFKVGHRIGLEIASMDSPPGYHFSFHVGSSKVTLHKICCDETHSSYLLLPVILKN